MALQKTVKTKFGIDVKNAYHRVREVKLQGKNYLHFKVKSFVDADQGSHFDEIEYGCAYDIAGDNPIKQAYEHLKTLPEFSGATDV